MLRANKGGPLPQNESVLSGGADARTASSPGQGRRKTSLLFLHCSKRCYAELPQALMISDLDTTGSTTAPGAGWRGRREGAVSSSAPVLPRSNRIEALAGPARQRDANPGAGPCSNSGTVRSLTPNNRVRHCSSSQPLKVSRNYESDSGDAPHVPTPTADRTDLSHSV